jgi:hypothetical protein
VVVLSPEIKGIVTTCRDRTIRVFFISTRFIPSPVLLVYSPFGSLANEDHACLLFK